MGLAVIYVPNVANGDIAIFNYPRLSKTANKPEGRRLSAD